MIELWQKKEFKIGEVFDLGINKVRVENCKNFCSHCLLNKICDDIDQCYKLVGECRAMFREDKTDVIFVKVEE